MTTLPRNQVGVGKPLDNWTIGAIIAVAMVGQVR
jgi:hypothetical protein